MAKPPKFTFTPDQGKFFQLKCIYPAFVGGFGSGKSKMLEELVALDVMQHPDIRIAVYVPNHDILVRNTVPRIYARFQELGFQPSYNKTEKIMTCKHPQVGTVFFSLMDNPDKIIAVEVFRAYVDELDTLKRSVSEAVWNKIIGRCRQVVPGTYDHKCTECGFILPEVSFTTVDKCPTCPECHKGQCRPQIYRRASAYTTPEGYEFVYDRWQVRGANAETEELRNPEYQMVQAKTRNNPFLDPNYVTNLLSSYPEKLANAYLNGEFVNMEKGVVYYAYNRNDHRSREEIQPGEELHIGCDFNKHNSAATVFVHRKHGKEWHAVEELSKVRDAKTLSEIIYNKYVLKGHKVYVYPDASGRSDSNADSTAPSCHAFFTQKGIPLKVKDKNPPLNDRINAMLVALENRRVFVNELKCPETASCLEKQSYKDNGQLDKDSGFDHQNDATTYPIAYAMPIRKPVANSRYSFANPSR